MQDHLLLLARAQFWWRYLVRFVAGPCPCPAASGCRLIQLRLAGLQNARNASPQDLALYPTAVCQRRVVGGGRSQVPALVGLVQPGTVPGNTSARRQLGDGERRTHLTTMTTAGCWPITTGEMSRPSVSSCQETLLPPCLATRCQKIRAAESNLSWYERQGEIQMRASCLWRQRGPWAQMALGDGIVAGRFWEIRIRGQVYVQNTVKRRSRNPSRWPSKCVRTQNLK